MNSCPALTFHIILHTYPYLVCSNILLSAYRATHKYLLITVVKIFYIVCFLKLSFFFPLYYHRNTFALFICILFSVNNFKGAVQHQ